MNEPIMTFARLLAPVTPDAFFDQYYEKKPLYVEGSREKVAGVCDWDDFNELIAKTGVWSDQTFKMVIDTVRVPSPDYCERAPGRDGFSLYIPEPHKVQKQLDKGASIVLDLVETLSPGIRDVARSLEMALATRVSCNAYCSQNQRKAFPSHFDSMEVFALHVEGTKAWNVYEGRFEDPLEAPGYEHTSFPPEYHEKAKGGLMMEIEMKPGDLLYLPKGWYHDALASSDACLHLSFSTAQTTGLNFARWLVGSLDQIPVFRKPMPPHDDAAGYEARVAELRDALMDVLARPEVISQFKEEQKAKAFGSITSVTIPKSGRWYRVRGRGVKVVRRGKDWQVTTPAGKGLLPEGGEAVVTWLLQRDLFRSGDLAAAMPQADEQKQVEMLQALSAVGVIEAL
ncbi:MAG: hypothetical protein D6773_17765 [Alphaproteobacteria bacterium]|nr:MAG: hypothetical protein D6773_17765 [Alphaproteobacteria bacterium]